MDDFMDRVHPELKDALEMTLQMPRVDLNDIASLRANPMRMPVPEINLPGLETITTEKRLVRGPDGAPDVAVEIYSPPRQPENPLGGLRLEGVEHEVQQHLFE